MYSVFYEFQELCHGNGKNYIFQFIKERRLTAVYHSHDFYELICFLRGDGIEIVNGERVACGEKTAMLLGPGDKHCFVSQSEDIEVVSLSVKKEEFEVFMRLYGVPMGTHPLTFPLPFTERIYEILRQSPAVTEWDSRLLLSTALHSYASFAETLPPEAEMPTSLRDAVEEMKKTENLKKGLSAFVSLSNYSHSHLARLVKKHFGMGLKEYINEMRLGHAYDDLVFTNEPFEAIAEALGFASYSHFFKIFKKRFQISPSDLRKGNGIASARKL